MKAIRTSTTLSLIALIACLPLFGATGATINAWAGTVAVNGRTVAASTPVATGDRVTTDAQGTVHMTLVGATLVAASKTNFKLETAGDATRVRLTAGQVMVTGVTPVALNLHQVVPVGTASQFTVTVLADRDYVSVAKGDVNVLAFGKSMSVHAGNAVAFDDQAPASAAGAAPAVAVPVVVGIAAAAAVVTGIVVHEATKCSNCVASAN